MMNKNNNECETKVCYESATRTRFYNGMLLTDQHLREEQQYHREKLKRANRHLFGSGIVCGLRVKSPEVGLCVRIEPGVALDCCGNLIEVCKCITLDLSKLCKEQYGQNCIEPDSRDSTPRTIKRYLVLRYMENESDPEPVLTPAADCRSAGEASKCQASKVREGYCVELWERCPCVESEGEAEPSGNGSEPGNKTPPGNQPDPNARRSMQAEQSMITSRSWVDSLEEYLDKFPLPCSPCGCCENALGLAYLTIDCTRNTVQVESTCRTYVITPRLLKGLFLSSRAASAPAAMRSMFPGSFASMSALGIQPEPATETPQEGLPADTVEPKTTTRKASAKKGTATTSEKSAGEAGAQPSPPPPAEAPKK